MVRPLIILLSIGAFASWARGELQFAPSLREYETEGVRGSLLAFHDKKGQEITYQQPPGWQYSGSGAKLVLRPPKVQAEATIETLPLSQPGSFDDESAKKLVDSALLALPKGSSDAAVDAEQKSPLRISGKETFLVTISYQFFGERYKSCVVFLNRENEQIRFRLTARAADFPKLQGVFFSSLCTWHNL
jgi:hypothetical protein